MSLCLSLCHGFTEVVPAQRTEWGTILPLENFTPVEPMSMFLDGCIFTVKDSHFRPRYFFIWLIAFDLSSMGNPTWQQCHHRHSSRGHLSMQATPPRQGKDTTCRLYCGRNSDCCIQPAGCFMTSFPFP